MIYKWNIIKLSFAKEIIEEYFQEKNQLKDKVLEFQCFDPYLVRAIKDDQENSMFGWIKKEKSIDADKAITSRIFLLSGNQIDFNKIFPFVEKDLELKNRLARVTNEEAYLKSKFVLSICNVHTKNPKILYAPMVDWDQVCNYLSKGSYFQMENGYIILKQDSDILVRMRSMDSSSFDTDIVSNLLFNKVAKKKERFGGFENPFIILYIKVNKLKFNNSTLASYKISTLNCEIFY